MNQVTADMLLIFFVVVGAGLCIVYGAQAGKVQFSLRTVFVMVTTSCVWLAAFGTFGAAAYEMIGWLLMVLMPPVNFVLVALLTVSVLYTREEQQAVSIGRLVPLVGLAVSDTIRVGALLAASQFDGGWSWIYFLVYVVAYLTALTSGFVCREAFRKLKKKPRPLHEVPVSDDEIVSGASRFDVAGVGSALFCVT